MHAGHYARHNSQSHLRLHPQAPQNPSSLLTAGLTHTPTAAGPYTAGPYADDPRFSGLYMLAKLWPESHDFSPVVPMLPDDQKVSSAMCVIRTIFPAATFTHLLGLVNIVLRSCHALCSVMLALHRCSWPSSRATSPWSGQSPKGMLNLAVRHSFLLDSQACAGGSCEIVLTQCGQRGTFRR